MVSKSNEEMLTQQKSTQSMADSATKCTNLSRITLSMKDCNTAMAKQHAPANQNIATGSALNASPRLPWLERKITWRKEEESKLVKIVSKLLKKRKESSGSGISRNRHITKEHNKIDWNKLALESFPLRSAKECREKYERLAGYKKSSTPWTKTEDQRIIELVQKHGPKGWTTIAQHIPERTSKQCRERW